MKSIIDINCDMGEIQSLLDSHVYAELMDYVTSVNLACGGHAGDEGMMRKLAIKARQKNVRIGAHPSYPDQDNFGRVEIDMDPNDLLDSICNQVWSLIQIAEQEDIPITHIKPHGALYNKASGDIYTARLIAEAVHQIDPDLPVMCLAGSLMVDVLKEAGIAVIAEAFADRTYESDGSLRKRTLDQSVITNAEQATQQAKLIASHNKVVTYNGEEIEIDAQTVCIHSDNPNALAIAKSISSMMHY